MRAPGARERFWGMVAWLSMSFYIVVLTLTCVREIAESWRGLLP